MENGCKDFPQHFTESTWTRQLEVCHLNSMWLSCCNYCVGLDSSLLYFHRTQCWAANQNISSNDRHISKTFLPIKQTFVSTLSHCALWNISPIPHCTFKFVNQMSFRFWLWVFTHRSMPRYTSVTQDRLQIPNTVSMQNWEQLKCVTHLGPLTTWSLLNT